MKKTLTTLALSSLFMTLPMSLFAQTTTSAATTSTKTTKVKVAPICLQNAFEKRDTAIISAQTALSTSLVQALTTRKDALKAAVMLSTKTETVAAKKAANQAFDKSAQTARGAMKTARNSAWTGFKSDTKACGEVSLEKPSVIEAAL